MTHESRDELSRRTFLKALGASLALAGLDGCNRLPAEHILPYVTQPPEVAPGVPLHYATSMMLDGYATGLIVETHEGRPTKIEGNPDHPASLGASGILEQASLLQLYDPDRGTGVRAGRSRSSWSAFAAAFAPAALRARVGARGSGLALLLEPTSSPLVGAQLDLLRATYPDARVHFHRPLASDALDAALDASGLVTLYDLRNADVILAAGADFLAEGPFRLRYARAFADGRRSPRTGMNRLYVAECDYTVTGGAADHRLPCRPDELEALLEEVLASVRGGASEGATGGPDARWSHAVADDLRAHAGRSVVVVGERQPPRMHALAAAINDALGNTGRTVWFAPSPLLGAGDPGASIAALAGALRAGAVRVLVCIGGNPSYATPGDMDFGALLRRVPDSARVGLYDDETARDCHWYVPAAHYLESWGDGRALDGTYSLVQPMLQPLHGGRSCIEVLAMLAGDAAPDARSMLRRVAMRNGVADDEGWARTLGRGFVPATAPTRVAAAPRPGLLAPATAGARRPAIVVTFAPDAKVHDGSFANNGWAQELPEPITKLTWGNAARIGPRTAAALDVGTGDILELAREGRTVRVPALVVPGHAEDAVSLRFGYGRRSAERVAHGVGVDVNPVWPSPGTFVATDVAVRRAPDGAKRALPITQGHWSMEGRDQARAGSLEQYRSGATKREVGGRRSLPIYDPPPRLDAPQQWAMTIDLGTCIGCSACVVACQAENNIPVVGPDDVANSREMHWIRIDRYLGGSAESPTSITQPMLCQQCENAPCEYVCPVGATTHSADGLNEMVYNRCVGTRFCSNNCPYKVRRFNWYDYNARLSETERMARNPDVTVRERGVMEKCTFCVQRIREAEIAATVAGRPLRGSEVRTACQQACPTNAIVFGSLTERDSEVARLRDDPRAYSVLDELGTRPRVEYLARVRNINPGLAAQR